MRIYQASGAIVGGMLGLVILLAGKLPGRYALPVELVGLMLGIGIGSAVGRRRGAGESADWRWPYVASGLFIGAGLAVVLGVYEIVPATWRTAAGIVLMFGGSIIGRVIAGARRQG